MRFAIAGNPASRRGAWLDRDRPSGHLGESGTGPARLRGTRSQGYALASAAPRTAALQSSASRNLTVGLTLTIGLDGVAGARGAEDPIPDHHRNAETGVNLFEMVQVVIAA